MQKRVQYSISSLKYSLSCDPCTHWAVLSCIFEQHHKDGAHLNLVCRFHFAVKGEIWRLETSTNLCLLLDLVLTSVELIDGEGKAFYGHAESHVSTDFQLRTLDTHTVLFFSGKSLHVNHFSCLCTKRFSILPVVNFALINSDLCSVLLSSVMCVPCCSRCLCSVLSL